MEKVCCYMCATPAERYTIFIVCPLCGNKRCPKSTDHRLDCTNSNLPDQPGSRYSDGWEEPADSADGFLAAIGLRETSEGVASSEAMAEAFGLQAEGSAVPPPREIALRRMLAGVSLGPELEAAIKDSKSFQELAEVFAVELKRREARMAFWLDDAEKTKLTAWLSTHRCQSYGREDSYAGAIGGALTYSFTPTSLGVVAKIRCACGAEVDATDYTLW